MISGLNPLSILDMLLLFFAGMYDVESQQGIAEPLPSRQTTPCHAYWMTDFKAYGFTSNQVYEPKTTQAVTHVYLTPFPTFLAKTQCTQYHIH